LARARAHVQHGRVRERGRHHGAGLVAGVVPARDARPLLRADRRGAAAARGADPLSDGRGDRRLQLAHRGPRRRGRLLRRHRLVRAHRVLGVAPRRGVRGRPRRLQGGRRAARRAAPDDDHAERASLVRRRLVVGAAEREHDRPARDSRREAPELLARRRHRRRRLVAALHRAAGRARPRVRVRAGVDPTDRADGLHDSRRRRRRRRDPHGLVSFRLAALVGAVAIAFADSAIVVLALPDLLAQYDVSINGVAWVVTAYNIALAVAALALVFVARRFDPARLALAGRIVFSLAALVCATAPDAWVLIAFRAVQGVAAAGLLVGALPVMTALAPGRGAALWAGAGVFGAALGPALGGALTEVFSWRAIFYAQAPVAAFGAVALVGMRGRAARPGREARPRLGAVALALVSAALVGLLFLAVVQLVDVWRLSPLGAGAVVSVIPLATLLVAPVAGRADPSAVAAGAVLLAARLAGMAFLPARGLEWVIASLVVAGVGFGLVMPRLTRTTTGANAVWIRHAGLVVGLLVITPVLTADLVAAGDKAKLRGISVALDAPAPAETKLRLAVH